jgi:lysophospholipase
MFTDGNAPMPIIVADGRAPGETLISLNATVFEFNPWEMGSHDPMLYGFAPLAYVGSNFSAGVLGNNDRCIAGFDNAGYIMGTSSTLFNQFLINIGSVSGIPSIVKTAITKILTRIGKNEEDIADWSPNPFLGWNTQRNLGATSRSLTLVDGGEDLQNIPLHPLIQPERSVDVIFAVDSSADTLGPGANWPNGTAIVATYARSMNPSVQNGTAFPAIPDQNTIVNLGLNKRPTFFGCNSSNMTGSSPIVVYLPNAPYIFNSNVSTFEVEYNMSTRNAMVENGYLVATMGNATLDANWPACVGCAILSRSLERTKTKVPDICTKCFSTYCWNGTVKAETPAVPYQPELIMPNYKAKKSAAAGSAVVGSGLLFMTGFVSLFGLI